MNNVGDRIRQLREMKGLSQDYMASQLGLTQPSYSRLEKNDERLTITRLQQIAELLETSIDYLFNKLTDEEHISIKNTKFINERNSQKIYAEKADLHSLRFEVEELKKQIQQIKKIS
jgi:transcriptional regulator with XRE-family HTH domain